MSVQITFPSESMIMSHLQRSDDTKELCSTKQNIITAVAKRFAYQEISFKNLKEEVWKLARDTDQDTRERIARVLRICGEIGLAKAKL